MTKGSTKSKYRAEIRWIDAAGFSQWQEVTSSEYASLRSRVRAECKDIASLNGKVHNVKYGPHDVKRNAES